jgi:hypothetical protein
MRQVVVAGVIATLLAGPVTSAASDAVLPAPRLYRATIETGLPHLEENLRYATTHETLCLGAPQLARAFPILHHVAFEGCALGDAHIDGDRVTFRLHCAPGSETTGSALWQIDAAAVTGTFEAKLGGKNMTLYQRITGRAVGACAPGG